MSDPLADGKALKNLAVQCLDNDHKYDSPSDLEWILRKVPDLADLEPSDDIKLRSAASAFRTACDKLLRGDNSWSWWDKMLGRNIIQLFAKEMKASWYEDIGRLSPINGPKPKEGDEATRLTPKLSTSSRLKNRVELVSRILKARSENTMKVNTQIWDQMINMRIALVSAARVHEIIGLEQRGIPKAMEEMNTALNTVALSVREALDCAIFMTHPLAEYATVLGRHRLFLREDAIGAAAKGFLQGNIITDVDFSVLDERTRGEVDKVVEKLRASNGPMNLLVSHAAQSIKKGRRADLTEDTGSFESMIQAYCQALCLLSLIEERIMSNSLTEDKLSAGLIALCFPHTELSMRDVLDNIEQLVERTSAVIGHLHLKMGEYCGRHVRHVAPSKKCQLIYRNFDSKFRASIDKFSDRVQFFTKALGAVRTSLVSLPKEIVSQSNALAELLSNSANEGRRLIADAEPLISLQLPLAPSVNEPPIEPRFRLGSTFLQTALYSSSTGGTFRGEQRAISASAGLQPGIGSDREGQVDMTIEPSSPATGERESISITPAEQGYDSIGEMINDIRKMGKVPKSSVPHLIQQVVARVESFPQDLRAPPRNFVNQVREKCPTSDGRKELLQAMGKWQEDVYPDNPSDSAEDDIDDGVLVSNPSEATSRHRAPHTPRHRAPHTPRRATSTVAYLSNYSSSEDGQTKIGGVSDLVAHAAAVLHACKKGRTFQNTWGVHYPEISSQQDGPFWTSGRTRWSSVSLVIPGANSDMETVLVFAISGPLCGSLQSAVMSGYIPHTRSFPASLVTAQIAELINSGTKATVVFTGSGIYANIAEKIMEETLMPLSSHGTEDLVFCTISFSPVPLSIREPLGNAAASLYKRLVSLKRLHIISVQHPLDQLSVCLGLLRYCELNINPDPSDRSIYADAYLTLEQQINIPGGRSELDGPSAMINYIKGFATKVNSQRRGNKLDRASLNRLLLAPDLASQATATAYVTVPDTVQGMYPRSGSMTIEESDLSWARIPYLPLEGTLHAFLLWARSSGVRLPVFDDIPATAPPMMVSQSSLASLTAGPADICLQGLSILCHRSDISQEPLSTSSPPRPARVLVTGKRLGLLTFDDLALDNEGHRMIPPGTSEFLRLRLVDQSRCNEIVELPEMHIAGPMTTEDTVMTLRAHIPGKPEGEYAEISSKVLWTSNGAASVLDPFHLLVSAVNKASIELVAAGLGGTGMLCNDELIKRCPRKLKTLGALRGLFSKLSLLQQLDRLMNEKVLGSKSTAADFASIAESSLAAEACEAAYLNFRRVTSILHPKVQEVLRYRPTFKPAVSGTVSGVGTVATVATVIVVGSTWWLLIPLAPAIIGLAAFVKYTRDDWVRGYIEFIRCIGIILNVNLQDDLPLEDNEKRVLERFRSLLEEKAQIVADDPDLQTAITSSIEPLLALREACSNTFVISLAGQKNGGKTFGLQELLNLPFHQRLKMKLGEGDDGSTEAPEVVGVYLSTPNVPFDVIFVSEPGSDDKKTTDTVQRQSFIKGVQTAAECTLLFVADPTHQNEQSRSFEPYQHLSSVLQHTSPSTDVILVGNKYDSTWNSNGQANRDKQEKRDILKLVIEPSRRGALRRTLCISLTAAHHPNKHLWDLDFLDDVRDELNDLFRRKSSVKSLAELVPIWQNADVVDYDLQTATTMHPVKRLTEKEYITIITKDLLGRGTPHEQYTGVRALLSEAAAAGICSATTLKTLRRSKLLKVEGEKYELLKPDREHFEGLKLLLLQMLNEIGGE